MGHIRLGRLPKTLRMREVVALLDTAGTPGSVAAAVALAAERRLQGLANDPALTYQLWLLTRATWAARGDGFRDQLAALGIDVPPDTTALGIIAALTDRARHEVDAQPGGNHFAEIGLSAFRQALTETVAEQGTSLFDGSAEDARRAFQSYSTRAKYGELARRYLAAFLSRALAAVVDRELTNNVGSDRAFSAEASAEFRRELDRHAWQTSLIVEDFAGDWYSKHNWETKGSITPDETQRFLAIALRKLRSELRVEADR